MTALSNQLLITKETCLALFAYDIGWAISLIEADRHITAGTERGRLRHKVRAPQYFEYRPGPLRLMQESAPLTVGLYQSRPSVEVTV